MKRFAVWLAVAVNVALIARATDIYAQSTFKIPFGFQAGDKKLPAGDYRVSKGEGQIMLRQESTGKEFQVPFTQRVPQPNPSLAEPQLVFDMVGNFAPSYTEYVTDYVLAEVWLQGEDGFVVHITKGAHSTKVIKPQPKPTGSQDQ